MDKTRILSHLLDDLGEYTANAVNNALSSVVSELEYELTKKPELMSNVVSTSDIAAAAGSLFDALADMSYTLKKDVTDADSGRAAVDAMSKKNRRRVHRGVFARRRARVKASDGSDGIQEHMRQPS